MEAQYVLRPSLTLAWIFLFFFPSVCTGINGQEIHLDKTAFVIFPGDDLSINIPLHKLTNQTEDLLCSDPHGNAIPSTKINTMIKYPALTLNLTNLTCSGLYNCTYNNANVKWYLLVTAKGQKVPLMWDIKEFIIVSTLIAVLLVFSVLGSVYVYRAYWTEKGSESLGTSRKQKQNREDQKQTEKEEDNMDMTTAQSSSFYASLEPRPRSIYDVLDCSAANSDDQQTKPTSQEKELSKEKKNAGHQDEGIFECVYENF